MIKGTIGGASNRSRGQGAGADQLTLEYTALRVINVEDFAGSANAGPGGATDVRKVDLHQAIENRLGAANKTVTQKELRNVGPSVS